MVLSKYPVNLITGLKEMPTGYLDTMRIMESKQFIDQFIRILMLEGVKQRTNTKKDYYID